MNLLKFFNILLHLFPFDSIIIPSFNQLSQFFVEYHRINKVYDCQDGNESEWNSKKNRDDTLFKVVYNICNNFLFEIEVQ